MTSPWQSTPQTGGALIEPDDEENAGTIDGQNIPAHNQDAPGPYWNRVWPDGVVIPPPPVYYQQHYDPQYQYHYPEPIPQQPPPDPVPFSPHDASQAQQANQEYSQTQPHVDEGLDLTSPSVAHPPPQQSTNYTQPNTSHAPHDHAGKPTSEPAFHPNPQFQDRPRCVHGYFKVIWCVQIEGQSHYQYQPPNLEELARHYHLLYFPDQASHDAQFSQPGP
ncbi:hypothetical protein B0J18DRAFT_100815 [Chaetomium sp. MPI-SDFR-AT-0129]|nr:hypothetical protein B0J18DRAFT_100815 [Chaetomium sp. MPI-SDFR-AT-0129]